MPIPRHIRRREAKRKKDAWRRVQARKRDPVGEVTTPHDAHPDTFRMHTAHLLREVGAQLPRGMNRKGKVKRMWAAFYRIKRDRIYAQRLLGNKRENEEIETILRERGKFMEMAEACALNEFIPIPDAIRALDWAIGYAEQRIRQIKAGKVNERETMGKLEKVQGTLETYQKRREQLRKLGKVFRELPSAGENDQFLVREKGRLVWKRVYEIFEPRLPKGVPLVRIQSGWFTSAIILQYHARMIPIMGEKEARLFLEEERHAREIIPKLL